MILTWQIMRAARSTIGSYSKKQLALIGLGLHHILVPSWKKLVLGKDFPEEVLKEFVELKDKHMTARQMEHRLEDKMLRHMSREIRRLGGTVPPLVRRNIGMTRTEYNALKSKRWHVMFNMMSKTEKERYRLGRCKAMREWRAKLTDEQIDRRRRQVRGHYAEKRRAMLQSEIDAYNKKQLAQKAARLAKMSDPEILEQRERINKERRLRYWMKKEESK